MSPRSTDSGIRLPAPTPSPIEVSSSSFHRQQQDHAGTGYGRHGQNGRRRKSKKPLSSGFKDIVWTKPPPVGLASTAPAATSSQRRESRPSPRSDEAHTRKQDHRFERTMSNVEPFGHDRGVVSARNNSSSGGVDVRRSPQAYHPKPLQPAAHNYQSQRLGSGNEVKTGASRRQHYTPTEAPTMREQRDRDGVGVWGSETQTARRAVGTSRSEEFVDQLAARALQRLPPPAAAEGTGKAVVAHSKTQSLPHALPASARWPSPSDGPQAPFVVERSLSDSSIVTASDFGGPKYSKPIILDSQMSDEDAIEGLMALLAKGKGLPVIKHSTGMGGGRSRKLLKLHQQGEWYLALCGILPPYFKTKIPVQDVDRVEAKWCCVVVHARGRSPIRLEVDSFSTADTLRLGLMALSRIEPESPPPSAPPTETNQQAAVADLPAVEDEDEDPQGLPPDQEDLTLSSVRPGHRSSQVYDPDAALSVAALLAKEMEEERLQARRESGGADGSMWASAHVPRSEASPPGQQAEAGPKPLLKRSASMVSVGSSRMAENAAPAVDPVTNRRLLPRGYGGPMVAPGAGGREELVVVDAKASLRRLYHAIEGRGMAAIKRNPNGKGRSRVMVRSRIKDNTIGWAHVLPPFTRKFVNVNVLVGAQRSSRVVTVKFKTREPVMFETDKLTDALILEQGSIELKERRLFTQFLWPKTTGQAGPRKAASCLSTSGPTPCCNWRKNLDSILTLTLNFKMKAALVLSITAYSISTVSAALRAAGAESLRNGGNLGVAASASRILQDGNTCDEETVFVDSQISDLNNPIGGCYETATTLLRGYPFYSLGGDASMGQAWIYVGAEGSWEIGTVEEVDDTTGDVTELKTVCTSEEFQAEDVSGPTDVQLENVWQCVYFENGLTNRLAGDFTGVECGCGGRTTVDADGDSGGGVNTTAIAIAVLVAIAVLAVVVCGCFIRINKKKSKAADVEAPKEGHDVVIAASS
eukprot:g10173.t1